MHVLLVEDSPINRRFLGLALSKAGIRMTCAENGRRGVQKAVSGGYDAILMDMEMPIMNGFEATLRLRQIGLTTPIIALTGHGSEEARDRCLRAGCTDHLLKPVDAVRLVETLGRLVARSVQPNGDSDEYCEELRQIALDYLDVQRKRIHEMQALLGQGDYRRLEELAHRIKGTAGTVGLSQFTAPAKRLEEASLHQDHPTCESSLEEIARLQSETELSMSGV